MIHINSESLDFSFTDIHPDAVLNVDFQRTLRIPDDGRAYHLPLGLGQFPLARVEQFTSTRTTIASAWVPSRDACFAERVLWT